MILLAGNSANQAIELLIQKGVPESYIIFLNLISVSSVILVISLILTNRFATYFHIHVIVLGPRRNSLCFKTVSFSEDSNIRDRCCFEWRVSCHTWSWGVWWPLLWHRWLMMIRWFDDRDERQPKGLQVAFKFLGSKSILKY